MTIQILSGDEIRSHVLKILSGECLFTRRSDSPHVYILSPWISDVTIEFSDLYVSNEEAKFVKRENINAFLFWDYKIKSINLPYAILLLKLHGGCEVENPVDVDIVTLPPNEKNYSINYLPRVKALLDFLDEIGCNVFVNSKLHSKLLLANDLALLGSFNLSKSALYDREEIGVSINDLDNLDRLEHYCWNIIDGSQPYGYSSSLNYLRHFEGHQITRGWLLDRMVKEVYGFGYGEFLNITGGYDMFIKSYARNLDLFYFTSLRRLISLTEDSSTRAHSGKDWIKEALNYTGEDPESIMDFVNRKFARKAIPLIRLQIKSLE